MKKTMVKLSLVVLLLVCMLGGVVQAATCKITLETSKAQYDKNEQIIVEFKMTEYRTTKGVALLMATLEYDTDSLKLEKVEGQNGWNVPTYNEENKTFIIDKNSNVTQNETFAKATFSVKENAKTNLTISLKDITVSEGAGDVTVDNANKNITIGTQNSGNNGNNGGNNSGNNNNGNNQEEGTLNIIGGNTQTSGNNISQGTNSNKLSNTDGSTASGKLPQTGNNNTILTVAIIGVVSVAAILFVKLKVMNKNLK